MAIVNNFSDEIGDIIRIKTTVPAVGIFTLNTFIDSTINETETRYFDKYFRHSIDGGLNFSDWTELSIINIQSIEIRRKDIFVIDYRYTRVGSDVTGSIAVNSVTISGESEPLESPNYARQFFFRFFDINDVNVLGWALNVLEKLYKRGVLPDYVTRDKDEYNPSVVDEDFLAYWGTITHFFAIFVYYARKFEEITTTPELIYQFLDNLGIFLNTNITDTHLLYLIDNYLEEYKKRGTNSIIARGDENIPDGELLRLITFISPDEFILALLEPHSTGWCVSKSSPTFNYTRHCVNMIKGYEYGKGFIDLDNYPTETISNLSIVNNELEIVPLQNTKVGIYSESYDNYIEIDDLVDYEIVVRVKQEDIIDNSLYFGCLCKNDIDTDIVLTSLSDNSDTNHFFEAKSLHRIDTEFEIRGIIHKKNFENSGIPISNFTLNVGFGNSMKFNDSFKTRYIQPFFYVQRTTADINKVILSDIKIRPMNFNFTLGKFGLKNIMYMLYRNNSTYLNKEVYRNTTDRLTPFNVTLIDREITTNI
jgi:hypothetical protein